MMAAQEIAPDDFAGTLGGHLQNMLLRERRMDVGARLGQQAQLFHVHLDLALGFLLAAQVEHERHAPIALFLKQHGADQDGDAPAILGDAQRFERCATATRRISRRAHHLEGPPILRYEIAPAHQPIDKVLAPVAGQAQEGIVGFLDVAGIIPGEDADQVGLNDLAQLFFAEAQGPGQVIGAMAQFALDVIALEHLVAKRSRTLRSVTSRKTITPPREALPSSRIGEAQSSMGRSTAFRATSTA